MGVGIPVCGVGTLFRVGRLSVGSLFRVGRLSIYFTCYMVGYSEGVGTQQGWDVSGGGKTYPPVVNRGGNKGPAGPVRFFGHTGRAGPLFGCDG